MAKIYKKGWKLVKIVENGSKKWALSLGNGRRISETVGNGLVYVIGSEKG